MAMSNEWVDGIFTKLSLVYGARFKSMYQGVSVEQVKADWAHELDGLNGESINYALKNLPADHPPNVLQFKALCKSERPPMRSMLPAPRSGSMSPKVKQRIAELSERMRSEHHDPLSGARSLRRKEQNGILLTLAQRQFWRQALAHELRREKTEAEEQQA